MPKYLYFLLLFILSGCEQRSEQEHLFAAKQAMQNQQLNTAVIELKNALKLAPENAESRFLLGSIYLKQGNLPAATKELERALEYQYDAEQVIPLLASTYQQTGEDQSLIKLSAKAKGLKPKQVAQLKFYQVQSYVQSGQHNKAKALIEEIKQIADAQEYSQLALSYDLVLAQKPDEAILVLQQLLDNIPLQVEALKLQGNLFLQTQQFDNAAKLYSNYINAYPEDVEVQFLLARLYSDLQQTEKAEKIVDTLLVKYPNQPLLLQLKASALLNKKQYESAQTYAEQSLALNPEDTPARLIAGISAYLLNDMEKTLNHLSLVVSLLPQDHPALRMLADAQLRSGLSLEASSTIERFEQIGEQDSTLLSGVGRALLQKGEVSKAKSMLAKQPESLESARALANKGLLKLSLNDVSGILDLEQALTAEQTAIEVKDVELVLAKAYLASQQYKQAMALAKAWQQGDTLQLQGFLLDARVNLMQNQTELAKLAYLSALNLTPENPFIKLELINLQPVNTQAQKVNALSEIEAVLKTNPAYLPAIRKHYILSRSLEQPESMSQHLIEIINEQQNNHAFRVALAKIYMLEGNIDAAIAQFELAKSTTPQRFWHVLATAYIQQKQYQKVVNLYQDWFQQQPNSPDAILGMLKVYESQNKMVEALALTERYLIELGGDNVEIQLMHLHYLAAVGQFDKLSDKLNTLPSQYNELPFIKGLRGQLQLNNKDNINAQTNLEIAYKAKPTSNNARLLSQALIRNKNAQTSISFLKRHITALPTDMLNILNYAVLQTGKNNKEAKHYYKKLIELNAEHFIAHNNLAYLYMQEHSYEQAETHAEQALLTKPKDPQVLDTLGSIELKLGKNEAALKHLTEAINLADKPTDEIKVNYLEALLINDKRRLADKKLKQFVINDKSQVARLEKLKLAYGI